MKNIVLTRIDDRLIHGQVVTAWIKPVSYTHLAENLFLSVHGAKATQAQPGERFKLRGRPWLLYQI